MNTSRIFSLVLTSITLTVGVTWPFSAYADLVGLQQPTATFSQTLGADFSVGQAIDGIYNDRGWAIAQNDAVTTNAETAVFETAADVGFLGGSTIIFTIYQSYPTEGQHAIGRFRLSVTTDSRSLFADGFASGGDVTANWTLLDANSLSSTGGATLTKLGDLSILASGLSSATDTYTISAPTTLTGITGIRLETFADASLPGSGPGRAPNGNFVLTELTVDIVPEPTSALLLLAGGAALCLRRRSFRSDDHNA